MRFEFTTAQKILFGPGTAREVPALAHSMGERALVIGGRSAERTSGLIRGLQEQAVETVTFSVSREFPRSGSSVSPLPGRRDATWSSAWAAAA